MASALIIVDVQHDFITGSLGGKGRRRVIDPISRLTGCADFVVSSLDWHPAEHCSFALDGKPAFTDGSWPVHCVAGTHGAELDPTLAWMSHEFVRKGQDPHAEAYSAFEGYNARGRSLEALLAERSITDLWVCGLVTEYCVKATALSARRFGYRTVVVSDAIGSVDSDSELAADAIQAMDGAGCEFAHSEQIIRTVSPEDDSWVDRLVAAQETWPS